MPEPTYIIGIDLGTTNSVVAYTKADLELGKTPDISVLEVPQITDTGTVENRNVLPSFILTSGQHDGTQEGLELPWDKNNDVAVGEFARERGAELPQRLIASSKSWLCHTLVDRNKPILPWEGPLIKESDKSKKSPVEAAAMLLQHIKDAWDNTIAENDTKLEMNHQEVFLTVPASFDAVARELTVKAADMAGISNITLLEEPQAAFYSWIESSGENWRKNIEKGDMVLVCDVGGGTSDFSLISVSEKDGELDLERIAVGEHLLVGGDNMDLALAHTMSKRMSTKRKKLDAWQMRGLWYACRKAKESLLTNPDDEEYPVTVLGRGKSLIGGTKKSTLKVKDIEKVILEGFFPKCKKDELPEAIAVSGIKEVGLSYEADPAITRHLARFLTRRKNGDEKMQLPTAILFNGGIMKAGKVRQRILDVVGSWAEKDETPLREIKTDDFDLTVAKGAAYYGLARKGKGVRIRGGLNRSYYIGIAASLPAVPGMPIPVKALCVAPFGMEEGTSTLLTDQEFVLVVGEPVKFDFLGSTTRLKDTVGTVVDAWEEDIEEITTIETVLDGEKGTALPVTLEMNVTEIGTLELWCVSREDTSSRWKLEFSVREKESVESS
ncbi:Hsp70 family protein [Desulfobacterales bacterium HSG16]|nr:Hsp70 family protein [Desulfobacterales bacterium HSG16]